MFAACSYKHFVRGVVSSKECCLFYMLLCVLFTDLLWNHPDKIWRHCCSGICKVSDISSVLLPHVSWYCAFWSSAWSHFPSSAFKLYW